MKAFVLIAISICYSQNYTLDQAVDIALQNKEALKASALDLRSSKQDVKSSYSGILPSVRVTGGVTESQFPRQSVGFNQSSGENSTNNSMNTLLIALEQVLGQDQFNALFGSQNELQDYIPTGQIEINGISVDESSLNYLFNQISDNTYQIQSILIE